MYSFMSSLAITHKELVCQCCVCSFCALYSHSNEWCWLDYSVSVRLLGGLQRSSYRVSLIWLSESIWVLSFVWVMVGSCVTAALFHARALHPTDRAVYGTVGPADLVGGNVVKQKCATGGMKHGMGRTLSAHKRALW